MKTLITIDPNQNTEKENYKFLTGTIIPRPIAFVTTADSKGRPNGAPFSYFNVVCANPPLISISVQRSSGHLKDTARNIFETKEFVVHVVDQTNVEQINQTAAPLPPHENELELAKLTAVLSTKVSVPGIKEAKVRMECLLEEALELGGSGEEPACDLIIGRVVQFHIDHDIYKDGKTDPQGLGAVSRLAGHDYATIGQPFEIKRPE